MTAEPALDRASTVAVLAAALTEAGVPVPPTRAAICAAAWDAVQPSTAAHLYWVARVTLLSEREQLAVFDAVFRRLFDKADPFAADPAEFRGDRRPPPAPPTSGSRDDAASAGRGWTPPTLVARHLSAQRSGGRTEPASDSDAVLAALSADELLRRRDLAELGEDELAAVRHLAVAMRADPPLRAGRRSRAARRGPQVDLRASLRAAVHTGGDPHRLVRRRRRPRPRRLVLLCDVSGSMEAYARPYLQLMSGVLAAGSAEAFVFATRLTRVTRALRSSSATRVLTEAGRAAPDWGGGTRIGEAVRSFLDGHGRRGMARGAVVVLLSDGWEAGNPALLAQQMQRLRRLAHRIVWVNPRSAAEGFQPLTGGLSAALPHVDRLVSGHSLAAMEEVLAAVRDD